jgi:hypothetical protein
MDRRVVLLPLMLLLAACATTQSGGPRRPSRVLLADEIAESVVSTAAEAVQQLRPQWLHTRGSPTFGAPDASPPTVYLDGVRMQEFRELERIRATVVQRMEYLSPSDATNRFGTDHTGGAILVTTR